MQEAIAFGENPFWSKAYILYLCPEANCLYISNTKIINLGETAVSSFYFILVLKSALGGCEPPPQGNPEGFFIVFVNYLSREGVALTN